jgi:hypothetical protein
VIGIYIIAWSVEYSAETLLSPFYFQRGGHTQFLQLLLFCKGWPIPSFPILLDPQIESSFFTARYLLVCQILGLMEVSVSLLYASCISLLCATNWFSVPCWLFFYFNTGQHSGSMGSIVGEKITRLIIFLLANVVVS